MWILQNNILPEMVRRMGKGEVSDRHTVVVKCVRNGSSCTYFDEGYCFRRDNGEIFWSNDCDSGFSFYQQKVIAYLN